MTTIDRTLESHLILNELAKKRELLTKLLRKYAVKTPQELENQIADGEVDEHPSYEDFLEMLSIENSIREIKELAKNLIEVI